MSPNKIGQRCTVHTQEILFSGRCFKCTPFHIPSNKARACFNHRYPNCQENIINCWNCKEDHPLKYLETELCENNIVGQNSLNSTIWDCYLCGTDHHVGFEILFDEIKVALCTNLKVKPLLHSKNRAIQCNLNEPQNFLITQSTKRLWVIIFLKKKH
jgi:hypothetical protein